MFVVELDLAHRFRHPLFVRLIFNLVFKYGCIVDIRTDFNFNRPQQSEFSHFLNHDS